MMTRRDWIKHYDPQLNPEIVSKRPPVFALLQKAAKKYPTAVAVKQEDYELTYEGLDKLSGILAGNLRLHGCEHQDRVAVMLPNGYQTVVAFWGIMKAGAVGVMTNPLYMESELKHHFADSNSKILITCEQLWPKIQPILQFTSLKSVFIVKDAETRTLPLDNTLTFPWEKLLSDNTGYCCDTIDPVNDLALLQYTGGTTGISKGCMLTHDNLSANALELEQNFHILSPAQEAFVGVLPYFHSYGLMVSVILPVILAAKVVPMPRFSPKGLLKLIETERISTVASAPSIINAILTQKELESHDLSSLKIFISGSAPLPMAQLELFEAKTGSIISEGYGLSEASPVTHFNPLINPRKAGSIGLPLPSTDAKIVDVEYGTREMPDGENGELIIKGPQVMKGYFNQPAQTDLVLRDGWLYTGDIGYRDAEGYFYITDRKKDLIISGGYNIYPREVEEILFQHPKVKEAVVAGVKHKTRGEVVKAFIVLKDNTQLEGNEIIDFCRKKMANYKVPREVEIRESLPKSSVGKVLRRLLADSSKEKD